MNLKAVHELGQSIWLDYIRRDFVRSGQLAALVEQGLRGLTSNPSIFEKAITGSNDYVEAIAKIADRSADAIYEQLAVEDIQAAADLLRPVYDESGGGDGFVSLEVSPLLARDTARTIDEARRLWKRVGRDNVMIKVPGTREGIPAFRQLISEGININVTLLFARDVFANVAAAYIEGLEALASRGGDLRRVASVASFFVSRIDVAVDRLLAARTELLGKAAIANAQLAYQDWKQRLQSERWQALAERGARVQRALWASTSTKDPRLPDVYYVEALIGPDTVDTMPPSTLDAFRDHGRAQPTLEADLDAARAVLDALPGYDIDLSQVTDRLTVEGVDSFRVAFEQLIGAVDIKRRELAQPRFVR
jgi:transaldolase / glucose-6-phosphate isomerase